MMFGWFEGLTRSRERKRMKKYQRKDAGEAWDEHRSREVRTLEKRKKKLNPAAAGQHWLAAAIQVREILQRQANIGLQRPDGFFQKLKSFSRIVQRQANNGLQRQLLTDLN